jgi:hypothetical protein
LGLGTLLGFAVEKPKKTFVFKEWFIGGSAARLLLHAINDHDGYMLQNLH